MGEEQAFICRLNDEKLDEELTIQFVLSLVMLERLVLLRFAVASAAANENFNKVSSAIFVIRNMSSKLCYFINTV